ncbi:MAG: hypothetical protein AB1Z19_06930 [Eubacteriales bacterium]
MKLSAPKKLVFWIAVALAAVAVLSILLSFSIPVLGTAWTAIVAFVLLALGNVLKGF